jgi:hypothetical protein
VDGKPSTTTIPAPIVAVTATASDNGIAPGDVSIAFSPKLLEVFNKLAAEAEGACAKRKKRQSCNARERFAQRVAEEAEEGGELDFISAGVRTTLPIVTAGDVAAIASSAGVGAPLALVAIVWLLLKKPSALTLSSSSLHSGGGDDDEDHKCQAFTGVNAVGRPLISLHQYNSKLTALKQPLCIDDGCKGDNTKRNQQCQEVRASTSTICNDCRICVDETDTTQGTYKGCDCLATAEVVGVINADMNIYDDGLIWMDEQQQILQSLNEASKPPFCVYGASPHGDRIPSEYCNCGDDDIEKTIILSVASSTTSPYSACPYTTDNGPTVTFESKSTPTPNESANCPVNSNDDVSSVTRTFWKGISKKFCDDVGDGKTAVTADLKNTDVQTRSIVKRSPPPSSSAFPDWKFYFEWEPKGSGTCVKNCEQAMDAFATASMNPQNPHFHTMSRR